jgi:hypothetical protein
MAFKMKGTHPYGKPGDKGYHTGHYKGPDGETVDTVPSWARPSANPGVTHPSYYDKKKKDNK